MNIKFAGVTIFPSSTKAKRLLQDIEGQRGTHVPKSEMNATLSSLTTPSRATDAVVGGILTHANMPYVQISADAITDQQRSALLDVITKQNILA